MQTISIRTDAIGDTYIGGYDRYTKADGVAREHFEQFMDNYERCFGEEPTREKLDAAFRFIDMFFGEVSECYPRSRYAQAVSELSFLVTENDGLEIAERLAAYASQQVPKDL